MTDKLLPKNEAKKRYTTPRLVCHGDVRSLTQAGSKGYTEIIMVLMNWKA
jgi:hypothetical protein